MIQYLKGFFKNIFNKGVSIFSIIDDKSTVDKNAKVYRNVKVVRSAIGKYTYIGPDSSIVGTSIGKFCSIARNVNIGLEGHTLNLLSTSPIFTEKINALGKSWALDNSHAYQNKCTIIGNDVWIGVGVKIINGVNIGDGAVIAAGAVVTKDVEPYSIVGGIPAKLIKKRFDNSTINNLLKMQWWNKSDEELINNISLFNQENISSCES